MRLLEIYEKNCVILAICVLKVFNPLANIAAGSTFTLSRTQTQRHSVRHSCCCRGPFIIRAGSLAGIYTLIHKTHPRREVRDAADGPQNAAAAHQVCM